MTQLLSPPREAAVPLSAPHLSARARRARDRITHTGTPRTGGHTHRTVHHAHRSLARHRRLRTLAAGGLPPATGPLNQALAEAQAGHAATIAAALRYPTALDAELLDLLGPGGSGQAGLRHRRRRTPADGRHPRLAHPGRRDRRQLGGLPAGRRRPRRPGRRLPGRHPPRPRQRGRRAPASTIPSPRDHRAAPLLRHPDFLGPIADLHRETLLSLLGAAPAVTAPEPR